MPAQGCIVRAAMSQQERQLRSRLTQIVSGLGIIRGNLLERERVCGNPGCRCTRGQKHRGVYLCLRKDGKYRQLYIPKEYELLVGQWVANHQQIRQLLKELGEVYWQKVKQRQG